jgi:hypothetical protein
MGIRLFQTSYFQNFLTDETDFICVLFKMITAHQFIKMKT